MINIVPGEVLLAGLMAVLGGVGALKYLPTLVGRWYEGLLSRQPTYPPDLRTGFFMMGKLQQIVVKVVAVATIAAGVFLIVVYVLGFAGIDVLGVQ